MKTRPEKYLIHSVTYVFEYQKSIQIWTFCIDLRLWKFQNITVNYINVILAFYSKIVNLNYSDIR